jgi:hypothetical protein
MYDIFYRQGDPRPRDLETEVSPAPLHNQRDTDGNKARPLARSSTVHIEWAAQGKRAQMSPYLSTITYAFTEEKRKRSACLNPSEGTVFCV